MITKVRKEFNKVLPSSIVIASSSAHPSPGGSSSLENEWKLQRTKKSPRHKNKTSSLSHSEDRGTWTPRRSIKSHHDASTSSTEERFEAPKLPVIQPVNVAFADALDYWKYRLPNYPLVMLEGWERARQSWQSA